MPDHFRYRSLQSPGATSIQTVYGRTVQGSNAMTSGSLRVIHPSACLDAHVQVPPSKSYTNRALIAAALADGTSNILGPSQSEDSEYLLRALQQFGVAV